MKEDYVNINSVLESLQYHVNEWLICVYLIW